MVYRFHRDQLLQLRSDKTGSNAETEEREDATLFAVLLTQRGSGMVCNNSSNLACVPELDGRRSTQRERSGLHTV